MEQRFKALLFQYGVDKERSRGIWKCLLSLYTDHHNRRYHNLMHIAKCLDIFDTMIISVPYESLPCKEDQNIIEFALWYHDIAYIPGELKNEETSASIARIALETNAKIAPPIVNTITECILATKHQGPVENPLAQIVCDIDLVSLAAPWNEFYVNNLNIRKEYEKYPDGVFQEGNRNLLNAFLARKTIYQNPYFINRYESRARENLHRHLANIS